MYELDPTDPDNNGYQNEDLIVWMRVAALPRFRKLHRRIGGSFTDGMPNGTYQLVINYCILYLGTHGLSSTRPLSEIFGVYSTINI